MGQVLPYMSEGEKRPGKSFRHVGLASLLSEFASLGGVFCLLVTRSLLVKQRSPTAGLRSLPGLLPHGFSEG